MLFFLFFFSLVKCTLLFPNKGCEIDDCSYQLQAPEGSCILYNTSMCFQKSSNINYASFKDLLHEDESKFKVLVVPYEAIVYDVNSSLIIPYYAVNISIAVFEKGIHQVALKLTEENGVASCRIFDFRKFSDEFPVNLFYDCFHNFPSKFKFHLEISSISTMEKLSYNVSIPSLKKIETLCEWKPSIVIFLGSLGQGTVLIKFSQAPSYLNISSYKVTFIPLSEIKMQTVFQVAADQNKSMLLLEFHPAFSDVYNLSITPSNFNSSGCHNAEMIPIPVGFFKYGKEIIIIMYACIAVFGIGVLFLLKYLCSYVNNLDAAFEPHVLLIYAINYHEESKLASVFSDYLSIQHGCRVSSIYGDDIDPEKYCAEKYQECNVILIILSEGLLKSSDLHPYCNQLIIANRMLRNQILQPGSDFEEKKIAMICFPYSSEDHIPEKMKLISKKCFMLPIQMNLFLCFLFGCKKGFRCIKHHLNFLLSEINASEEYSELIRAIKAVQFAVELNSHSKDLNLTRFIKDNEDFTDNSDPSLFLEKNSDDFSPECNPKTFIQSIVHGSFTSIAHEPDNGSSHQIESNDALEFPNILELIPDIQMETDSILQQLANKDMGCEEPDNVIDFSSLLDQINKSNEDDFCLDPEKSGLLNYNEANL